MPADSTSTNETSEAPNPFRLEALHHDQIRFLARAMYHEMEWLGDPVDADDRTPGGPTREDLLGRQACDDTVRAFKGALNDYYRADPEQGLALWLQMARSPSAQEAEFAADMAPRIFDLHPLVVLDTLIDLSEDRDYLEGEGAYVDVAEAAEMSLIRLQIDDARQTRTDIASGGDIPTPLF